MSVTVVYIVNEAPIFIVHKTEEHYLVYFQMNTLDQETHFQDCQRSMCGIAWVRVSTILLLAVARKEMRNMQPQKHLLIGMWISSTNSFLMG